MYYQKGSESGAQSSGGMKQSTSQQHGPPQPIPSEVLRRIETSVTSTKPNPSSGTDKKK